MPLQPCAKTCRALQLQVQAAEQGLALLDKGIAVQCTVFQALMQLLDFFQGLRHVIKMPRPGRCGAADAYGAVCHKAL